MATRQRAVDIGVAQGRAIVSEVCREIKDSRLDRALSQQVVADAAGISRGWLSLVERGRIENLTIQQAAFLMAVVGLRLQARGYPDGAPIRDAAHVRLLERFRLLLHASLRWATEVPLPIRGDLRAWDGMVSGDGWRLGVEAETRPRDLQAMKRRLLLKARDGEVDGVVLVLLNSAYNRQLIRADADGLAESFQVPGPRALELLRAGVRPNGNAIVLL
jgi:transcriptional regulator with XRE-family HTH domain